MVAESDLLESRGFLSDIDVWPGPLDLNLEQWLSNFDAEDRDIALSLLESHVHITQRQLEHGAVSAFTSMSTRPEFGNGALRQESWAAFLDRAFVIYPAGSAADATGSGQIFARAIRDAGFDEARILPPEICVARIAAGQAFEVVFVDDLSASGSQFTRTWARKVRTDSGTTSFEDLAAAGSIAQSYYVPLIATTRALDLVAARAPQVHLLPAYTLEDEYFASSELTRLVAPDQRPRLADFAAKYAERSGNAAYGPYGFGALGLALSFHHATPNNTMPVLQRRNPSTLPGWKVLIS